VSRIQQTTHVADVCSSSVEFRWGNGFDFTSVPSKSRSTKGHIQCSFCGFWEEASNLDVFAYDSDIYIFRFNPFLALTWCFSGCSREASFVDTENWAATATGANPSSGRRKGGAALQVLVRNGGYHWSGVQQWALQSKPKYQKCEVCCYFFLLLLLSFQLKVPSRTAGQVTGPFHQHVPLLLGSLLAVWTPGQRRLFMATNWGWD
jgi:hypothetical protein